MRGHLWQSVVAAIEVAILSALILIPRCANFEQVLVAGNVYYTDADCYARMTRVRLCLEHPGLIVRHHDFENFPQGITSHTTAPLDYLILALVVLLRPFSTHALDLAGALVSPLLALAGGWFLWGWARRMKFRYGWPMLILFAVSPIMVHATELGRPDHQSLVIVLLIFALCAEWSLVSNYSRYWSVLAGCSWGLALWVSLYEPLILFAVVVLISLLLPGPGLFNRRRSIGWMCFLVILALALLVERRVPSFVPLVAEPLGRNWLHDLGELRPVPFFSLTWLRWAGGLVVLVPLLVWLRRAAYFHDPANRRRLVLFLGLLGATFLLTLGQARWSYFFVLVFALALPALLEPFPWRGIVWTIFLVSLWPLAQEWDERLWPNESESARRAGERRERVDLRELALTMASPRRHAFLAPWWLSPSLAYWSGQPAVAGSAHEGLAGILDTARFYAAENLQKAREIMENRQVDFVLSYDADRLAESCRHILGQPVPKHALCYVLDRAPAMSPRFLVLAAQNPTGKLFRVANNR